MYQTFHPLSARLHAIDATWSCFALHVLPTSSLCMHISRNAMRIGRIHEHDDSWSTSSRNTTHIQGQVLGNRLYGPANSTFCSSSFISLVLSALVESPRGCKQERSRIGCRFCSVVCASSLHTNEPPERVGFCAFAELEEVRLFVC